MGVKGSGLRGMESADLGCTENCAPEPAGSVLEAGTWGSPAQRASGFRVTWSVPGSSTCRPEVAAGTVRALRAEEVLGRDELRKEPYWEVLSRWWGRLSWSLGLPRFMALPLGPQEVPRYLLKHP